MYLPSSSFFTFIKEKTKQSVQIFWLPVLVFVEFERNVGLASMASLVWSDTKIPSTRIASSVGNFLVLPGTRWSILNDVKEEMLQRTIFISRLFEGSVKQKNLY